jgi:hypothetical protein
MKSSVICDTCIRPSREPNLTKAPNSTISTTSPSSISCNSGLNTRASKVVLWNAAPSPGITLPSSMSIIFVIARTTPRSLSIFPSYPPSRRPLYSYPTLRISSITSLRGLPNFSGGTRTRSLRVTSLNILIPPLYDITF